VKCHTLRHALLFQAQLAFLTRCISKGSDIPGGPYDKSNMHSSHFLLNFNLDVKYDILFEKKGSLLTQIQL
jgi:hypothetical protein